MILRILSPTSPLHDGRNTNKISTKTYPNRENIPRRLILVGPCKLVNCINVHIGHGKNKPSLPINNIRQYTSNVRVHNTYLCINISGQCYPNGYLTGRNGPPDATHSLTTQGLLPSGLDTTSLFGQNGSLHKIKRSLNI